MKRPTLCKVHKRQNQPSSAVIWFHMMYVAVQFCIVIVQFHICPSDSIDVIVWFCTCIIIRFYIMDVIVQFCMKYGIIWFCIMHVSVSVSLILYVIIWFHIVYVICLILYVIIWFYIMYFIGIIWFFMLDIIVLCLNLCLSKFYWLYKQNMFCNLTLMINMFLCLTVLASVCMLDWIWYCFSGTFW